MAHNVRPKIIDPAMLAKKVMLIIGTLIYGNMSIAWSIIDETTTLHHKLMVRNHTIGQESIVFLQNEI